MHLHVEAFLQTLPIMGYGMIGIFAIMLLLYLSIVILLKIFTRHKKEEN